MFMKNAAFNYAFSMKSVYKNRIWQKTMMCIQLQSEKYWLSCKWCKSSSLMLNNRVLYSSRERVHLRILYTYIMWKRKETNWLFFLVTELYFPAALWHQYALIREQRNLWPAIAITGNTNNTLTSFGRKKILITYSKNWIISHTVYFVCKIRGF